MFVFRFNSHSDTMRLLLVVCVLVALIHGSHGGGGEYFGSMFNRNGGLLQAFNGANNDNNNRDTDGMYMYRITNLTIFITKACPCNI